MLNRPSHPPFLFSIGHYQVLSHSLLGKGFNSSLYEGVNTITGEHVCIKRIILNNDIQHSLYLNEVSCLKTIGHENVLRYLHHFQIGNFAYIVTELCQDNLFARIFKKGKLEEMEALGLFLQILGGYEEIRKKDFLHRDIKPENIFFKDGHIKIGDFGFSVRLRTPELRERYNVGSPLYMAPEVLMNNIYSEKSDIWSLGILLYEMIHGQNPFQSKWEKDLLEQMKRATFKYNCDPQLANILKETLAFNKENRFNLKDLKEAIIRFMFKQTDKEEAMRNQDEKVVLNEIRYVRFMEYIKILISKCKKPSKSERISFLFQFCIRLRLSLIDQLRLNSSITSRVLNDELALLKTRHQYSINTLEGLKEGDRLRFLNPQSVAFDYFVLWQIQAELKDTLTQILRGLPKLVSQAEVAKNEQQLRLTDFLMTAYVLNRSLIQSQNNMEQFMATSPLSLILNRPQRFNLAVYKAIRMKGENLHLL